MMVPIWSEAPAGSASAPALYFAVGACALLWLWWCDFPLRAKLFVRRYLLREKDTPRLPPGNFGMVGHVPWILWDFFTKGGNCFDVLGELQRKGREQYGPIRCGSLPPLGRRFVHVSSDDCLQWIFSKENKGFEEKLDPATANLLGAHSLILQKGKFHKKMRSALMPLFQSSFLSTYCSRMNKILDHHLSEHWSSPNDGETRRIKVGDEMKALTFKIISDLILGIDIDKELGTVKRLIHLFQVWQTGIMMGGEVCNLSDDQIFDSLLLLLFAGSDTSTTSMTWMVKRLIEQPDVFAKLREEHLALQERRPNPPSRHITWDEIAMLKYTNQVIFENMRFVMPAAQLFSGVTEDCVYNGYLFPKGYRVFLEIQNTVRSYIPDEDFNPDRFKSDNYLGALKVEGFKPFGGGVRMCLGYRLALAEMTVFLHHFVLGYEFEAVREASNKTSYFPFPMPEDGLPVDVVTVQEMSDLEPSFQK